MPGIVSIVSDFIAEMAESLCEYPTWNPANVRSNMLDSINTNPIENEGGLANTQLLIFD